LVHRGSHYKQILHYFKVAILSFYIKRTHAIDSGFVHRGSRSKQYLYDLEVASLSGS
jgi:hypothetical protein